jgi:hypothetical protein
MPTINQLPVLSPISSGDQLPVYSPNNGDARRTSIGSLLTFFQQSFASPTLSVNCLCQALGLTSPSQRLSATTNGCFCSLLVR